MKKADKIAYKQKSVAELHTSLTKLQKDLVEARAKQATGNLRDTSVFKKIKYQISLIHTLIHDQK